MNLLNLSHIPNMLGRRGAALAAVGAAAIVFAGNTAAAQTPPPPAAAPAPMAAPVPYDVPLERDGVRFRGAIQGEAGTLLVPEFGTALGYGGVSGQLGVQINNLVGVYMVPTFDIVVGELGGVHLGSALVVDFTINDIVSLGVGPDVALFAAIGAEGAAAGALLGGRLRATVYPVLDKSDNGYSRQALAIGLDLRLMSGPVAAVTVDTAQANDEAFVFAPQLTIGYQAF